MSRERKARRDARRMTEGPQFQELFPMGSPVDPAQLVRLIRDMTRRGARVELEDSPRGGTRIRLRFEN